LLHPPPRDQAAAFRPNLGTLCWRFEPKAQPERHLQDFKGDKVQSGILAKELAKPHS